MPRDRGRAVPWFLPGPAQRPLETPESATLELLQEAFASPGPLPRPGPTQGWRVGLSIARQVVEQHVQIAHVAQPLRQPLQLVDQRAPIADVEHARELAHRDLEPPRRDPQVVHVVGVETAPDLADRRAQVVAERREPLAGGIGEGRVRLGSRRPAIERRVRQDCRVGEATGASPGPIRRRRRAGAVSLIASVLASGRRGSRPVEESARGVGPDPTERLERLAAQPVVGREEGLDLVQQVVVEVGEPVRIPALGGAFGQADQPVVSIGGAVAHALLRLDRAQEANADDAARVGRRIHQHQDVERIPIGRERPWQEAEIERKGQPGREARPDLEGIPAGHVLELVLAALRRLEDRAHAATPVHGRERLEVRHRSMVGRDPCPARAAGCRLGFGRVAGPGCGRSATRVRAPRGVSRRRSSVSPGRRHRDRVENVPCGSRPAANARSTAGCTYAWRATARVLPSRSATSSTAATTAAACRRFAAGRSSRASASNAASVPCQVRKSLAENSSPIAAWM